MMILGVAVGAAIAEPSGGFTKHEKLSMNSLVLFSAIAALLGVLALIGTRYRWIRGSGRLILFIVAPILLAVHLNYSWISSGPVHRLDASIVTGLVSSLAAAIALWELTCWLGRRQAIRLAEQIMDANLPFAHQPPNNATH
jgi:fucose 4-O-acetylase-like acetyltransferase